MVVLCCGRDDAEVGRRAAAIGKDPDGMRPTGLVGTPDEAIATVGEFAMIRCTRLYLQVRDLADLDHLEFVAAEVAPQVR
jgi:hypothetical protein